MRQGEHPRWWKGGITSVQGVWILAALTRDRPISPLRNIAERVTLISGLASAAIAIEAHITSPVVANVTGSDPGSGVRASVGESEEKHEGEARPTRLASYSHRQL